MHSSSSPSPSPAPATLAPRPVVQGTVIGFTPPSNNSHVSSPLVGEGTAATVNAQEEKRRELEEITRKLIEESLNELENSYIRIFNVRISIPISIKLERWFKLLTVFIIGIAGIAITCDARICVLIALANVLVISLNLCISRSNYSVTYPQAPYEPGLADQTIQTDIIRRVYKWKVDGIIYDVYDEPEDPDSPNCKLIHFKGQLVNEYELALAFQKYQIGLGKKLDGKPITIKIRKWSEEVDEAQKSHEERTKLLEELMARAKADQKEKYSLLIAAYTEECRRWYRAKTSFLTLRRRLLIICDILLVIIPMLGIGYAVLCPGVFPLCSASGFPSLAMEIYFEFSIYSELNKKISFEQKHQYVHNQVTVVTGFSGWGIDQKTQEEIRQKLEEEEKKDAEV
jgi:hypothetical protein